MFEKILVPIDGSVFSDRAVNYAIDLAKKYSSKICLIHIISTATSIITGVDTFEPSIVFDITQQREENGRKILNLALARVEKEKIEGSKRLEHGNPADKIIQIAEAEAVDLIILGDKGLGAVARFFLGSVTNGVSHHAKCPVLIVK